MHIHQQQIKIKYRSCSFSRDVAIILARCLYKYKFIYVHIYSYNESCKVLISNNQMVITIINDDTSRMGMQTIYERFCLSRQALPPRYDLTCPRQKLDPTFILYIDLGFEFFQFLNKHCKNDIKHYTVQTKSQFHATR
jgi:hypothetical protein